MLQHMKTPTEYLNSPDGVRAMKDEIDRFYDALDLQFSATQATFPYVPLSLVRHGHLHGGYNFSFEGNTFVSQHSIPSKLTTEGAIFTSQELLDTWYSIFIKQVRDDK